jgi:hypothetical protein
MYPTMYGLRQSWCVLDLVNENQMADDVDGTDTCLGAVFSNHFCYLKGSNVCGGDFSNTSPGSQAAGAAINLIGDCAAWSGYVPPGMDAVCCNS